MTYRSNNIQTDASYYLHLKLNDEQNCSIIIRIKQSSD